MKKCSNIIDILEKAPAGDRPQIMEGIYRKNREFFARKFPEINLFLDNNICDYHVDITPNFLNIVKTSTGHIAHPDGQLAAFARLLGDWSHNAWIDFCNFIIKIPGHETEHGRLVEQFNNHVREKFSDFTERLKSSQINLKVTEREDYVQKFSPPVVFVGIFHGLHIAHYLSRTDVRSILLIEPEPQRFLLSCYFLDYEKIFRQTTMYLVIGDKIPGGILEKFMAWHKITPFVWLRVLPGYESASIEPVISKIRLWQLQHFSFTHAFDIDMQGIRNSIANINAALPILTRRPRISNKACIAVVGSGPSLDRDLEWIQKHQSDLIIFAAHSAVKILKKHGIKPDFQFAIDIHLDEAQIRNLQLFRDVPLITSAKSGQQYAKFVDKILLVEDQSKAHPVRFFQYLKHMYPSTGNMALAMALLCCPRYLYLLGLDFGYKRHDYQHARGDTLKTEFFHSKTQIKDEEKDILVVDSNFGSCPEIITNPFYNLARLKAEAAISGSDCDTEIFNLSDGALIEGATPKQSSQISLTPYNNKYDDIKCIAKCFQPAQKGVNWDYYSTSGTHCLQQMRQCILQTLRLKSFDWTDFSKAVDDVMPAIMQQMRNSENDVRMEVYFKLIADLLLIFYRFVIICDDKEQAAFVYETCYEALRATIMNLDWPENQLAISD